MSNSSTKEIRSSVRLCAAERGEKLSQADLATECESLERALEALEKHARINNMRAEFVSCDVNSGTANDSASYDTDSVDGQCHYLLVVRYKNTRDSEKLHESALVMGKRAGRALEDCFEALSHRRRASSSVKYSTCDAEFQASDNAYVVSARFTPPKGKEPAPTKVHKPPTSGKRKGVSATLPTEEECLAFYADKAHLWDAFGHDLQEKAAKRQKT